MRRSLLLVVLCAGCTGAAPVQSPTPAAPARTPGLAAAAPVELPAPLAQGRLRQIAAGDAHSCVRRTSGTVACWGLGRQGQLGHGSFEDSAVPVAVAGLTEVVHIALGNRHSCAALRSGEVMCWGEDHPGGALGTGRYERSATPQRVPGVSRVSRVAAGFRCSCGLRTSGEVSCWGTMGTKALARPIDVGAAIDIAAGGERACAVTRAAGEIFCWGELGPGLSHSPENSYHEEPVKVRGITGAVRVFAGGNEVCALNEAGELRCWGPSIDYYEHDSADTPRTPEPVGGLGPVAAVALGNAHGCAITTAGALVCWGLNTFGELGDGTREERAEPVAVQRLERVVDVATGHVHSCAITAADTVACWGRNYAGQVGDSTADHQAVPGTLSGL